MKFILLLTFIPFIGLGQTSCDVVKKGSFKLIDSQNGNEYIIKRTKKYQTAHNTKDNRKYKQKIMWIDECRYKLIPLENKKRKPKIFLCGRDTKRIKLRDYVFEIISVQKKLIIEKKIHHNKIDTIKYEILK